MNTTSTLNLSAYEAKVAELYDAKKDDINFLLGKETDLIHHHFGIGQVNADLFNSNDENAILNCLHELENAQVEELLKLFGPMPDGTRIFDGGSGRGGTALMFLERFKCRYYGATISAYQQIFATNLMASKGLADRASFHIMNMKETEFENGFMNHVLTNETTMYVDDLNPLFREFNRILTPSGSYVFATWCIDDNHPDAGTYTDFIDEHYVCTMHTAGNYLRALLQNGFLPDVVLNLNEEALPYWELRACSSHRTGIEESYIKGYKNGAIKYIVVRAIKVRNV